MSHESSYRPSIGHCQGKVGPPTGAQRVPGASLAPVTSPGRSPRTPWPTRTAPRCTRRDRRTDRARSPDAINRRRARCDPKMIHRPTPQTQGNRSQASGRLVRSAPYAASIGPGLRLVQGMGREPALRRLRSIAATLTPWLESHATRPGGTLGRDQGPGAARCPTGPRRDRPLRRRPERRRGGGSRGASRAAPWGMVARSGLRRASVERLLVVTSRLEPGAPMNQDERTHRPPGPPPRRRRGPAGHQRHVPRHLRRAGRGPRRAPWRGASCSCRASTGASARSASWPRSWAR